MKPAFYMQFVNGHFGSLDRTGGLPTHLPPEFPLCPSGKVMAFLAQFYCTDERLTLPGTLCIQLYQDVDVDMGGGPWPVAVSVPVVAKPNIEGLGVSQPTVGSSRVDLQACKLEYSIVSPK